MLCFCVMSCTINKLPQCYAVVSACPWVGAVKKHGSQLLLSTSPVNRCILHFLIYLSEEFCHFQTFRPASLIWNSESRNSGIKTIFCICSLKTGSYMNFYSLPELSVAVQCTRWWAEGTWKYIRWKWLSYMKPLGISNFQLMLCISVLAFYL